MPFSDFQFLFTASQVPVYKYYAKYFRSTTRELQRHVQPNPVAVSHALAGASVGVE